MIKKFASTGTLKTRITLVVVFLVMLAAALVTYVSLHLAEREMRSVVGDQQFALLSSVAAYIDEDLVTKKTLLMTLQEQLTYTNMRGVSSIQGFLEAHGGLRDEFSNVIALDQTGKIIANLNDPSVNGSASFSKRDYFIDTVAGRKGVISYPFKSILSGKPVIVVTEPVYNAVGELVTVLVGSIDLQRQRFFGQLETLKSGTTGYLFMLTTDGTIIHHPDKQRILKNVKQEAGGAVASTLAAMNGFEGTVEGKSKRGIVSLITYKKLHNTDWIIGAVYPVDEAFAPLIAMRTKALFASAAVAVAAGLLGWLAILRLLRPLGALRKHVARLSEGSENIEVFDVARKDEFGELSRAFFFLSQQRRDAESNLMKLTRTDPLTGIANRRMFDEVFAAALERARRNGQGLGLAYLDVDRFKQINDTHGHGVGDLVLVEFAQRLKQCVRITDTVARLAGDEFVVVFEHLGGDAEADGLAQKVLDALRPDFLIGELALKVTASVGIAVNMDGGGAVADFVEAADKALYDAKGAGRSCFAVRAVATTQWHSAQRSA
jgi:diguanylate cyclase (GGDEF)-like protein